MDILCIASMFSLFSCESHNMHNFFLPEIISLFSATLQCAFIILLQVFMILNTEQLFNFLQQSRYPNIYM